VEEEDRQVPLSKIRFPSVFYRHVPEGPGQEEAGDLIAVQSSEGMSLKDMSLREQVRRCRDANSIDPPSY
jgi:hypothetical protein